MQRDEGQVDGSEPNNGSHCHWFAGIQNQVTAMWDVEMKTKTEWLKQVDFLAVVGRQSIAEKHS